MVISVYSTRGSGTVSSLPIAGLFRALGVAITRSGQSRNADEITTE